MGFQSKTVGVAAIVTTAVVAYLARRSITKPGQDAPESIELSAESSSTAESNEIEARRNRRGSFRKISWRVAPYLVIASLLFSGGAGLAAHFQYSFAAGIGLLIAMALSFFALPSFAEYGMRKVLVPVALIVFILQFMAVVLATIIGMTSSIDPISLIELTVFGLTGLGLLLALVASWSSGWPYWEPLALGLIAAALGALCFPAIRGFTEPLDFPIVTGSGLLFTTGPANQPLALNVFTDPLDVQFGGTNNSESFSIIPSGYRLVHWALLLSGDARLKDIHLSGQIKERTISARPSQPLPYAASGSAQLFSGTANLDSVPSVDGTPFGTFAQSTSDRSAVSLPYYGITGLEFLPSTISGEITDVLGGKPTFLLGSDSTINIDGGFLPPSESVSQSSPAMTPNPSDQNDLQWTTHSALIGPSFALANQGAIDITNNILFVFAVLLGAAGAAFIACLQAFIRIRSSRNSTVEPDQHSPHDAPRFVDGRT